MDLPQVADVVAVSAGRVLLLTEGHIIMLRSSTSGGGGGEDAAAGSDYSHKWRVRVSEVQAIKGALPVELICSKPASVSSDGSVLLSEFGVVDVSHMFIRDDMVSLRRHLKWGHARRRRRGDGQDQPRVRAQVHRPPAAGHLDGAAEEADPVCGARRLPARQRAPQPAPGGGPCGGGAGGGGRRRRTGHHAGPPAVHPGRAVLAALSGCAARCFGFRGIRAGT